MSEGRDRIHYCYRHPKEITSFFYFQQQNLWQKSEKKCIEILKDDFFYQFTTGLKWKNRHRINYKIILEKETPDARNLKLPKYLMSILSLNAENKWYSLFAPKYISTNNIH